MGDDTLLIILGNQLFDKKYLSEGKTKNIFMAEDFGLCTDCLLYTSPSPRDLYQSRMPSSA